MSSIKLKHSGGNSVSIAAPSSNPAANRTITLNDNYAGDGSFVTANSSGNVGIGTATPAQNLDVTSTNNIAYALDGWALAGKGDSSDILFGGILGSQFDTLKCYTSGSERMRIDSSGKLLLGTTTAGAAQCDTFTLETSGHTGMTFFSGSSSRGTIAFGDGRTGNEQYRGAFIYDHSDDSLRSVTADVERMRILSDGHVCIGRTNATIDTSNFGTSIGGGGIYVSRNVTGASHSFGAYGNQGNALVMGDGDLLNTNGSYGSLSDETLKQDIVDAASQWDDIKNIRVRKFRFKDNPKGPLQIGVVAQEIEKVSAGLVSDRYLDGKADSGEKVKSVKYSVLHMKAVKALQEAQARIETLETEKTKLQTDLTNLTTRVAALEAG